LGLQLADILSRNWLVLLVRGLLAIIFGFLALLLTKNRISVLITPFAAYAFVDGVLALGIALGEPAGRGSLWLLLLWGCSGVGAGILTYFVQPPRSRLEFMCYIAIWAVTTGVFEVLIAVRLHRKLGAEWLLILAGLMSVVFGASIVALSKAHGAFVLSRLIAAYAFAFGVLIGIIGLRARTAPLPSA